MAERYLPNHLQAAKPGGPELCQLAGNTPLKVMAAREFKKSLGRLRKTPLSGKFVGGRFACVPVYLAGSVLYTEAYSYRFDAGNGCFLDLTQMWEEFDDGEFFDLAERVLAVVERLTLAFRPGMRLEADNSDEDSSSADDLFTANGSAGWEMWGFELARSPREKKTGRHGELDVCGPIDGRWHSLAYGRVSVSFPEPLSADDISLAEGLLPELKELSELLSVAPGTDALTCSPNFHLLVWAGGEKEYGMGLYR